MLRIEQVGDLVTRQVERKASPEHRKNKLEISEPELHFQPLHNAEAVACSAHLIEAALRRPTAFKRLTPSIAFHCGAPECKRAGKLVGTIQKCSDFAEPA